MRSARFGPGGSDWSDWKKITCNHVICVAFRFKFWVGSGVSVIKPLILNSYSHNIQYGTTSRPPTTRFFLREYDFYGFTTMLWYNVSTPVYTCVHVCFCSIVLHVPFGTFWNNKKEIKCAASMNRLDDVPSFSRPLSMLNSIPSHCNPPRTWRSKCRLG